MENKKETDIGLNTLAGRIVVAGLTTMGLTAVGGAPAWVIVVATLVVLVGVVICTRSFWWRR